MYFTGGKINLARKIVLDGSKFSSTVRRKCQGSNKTSGTQKIEDSTSYISFSQFLNDRLQEASRSIVVKIPDWNSSVKFKELCSSCGTVSNFFIYENDFNKYILVEMSQQQELLEIFKASGNNSTHMHHSYLPFQLEFGVYFSSSNSLYNTHVNTSCVSLKPKSFKNIMQEVSSKYSLCSKINHIYEMTKMNDLETRLKFLLCKQFQRLMCGIYDVSVYPFGSSVCGFGVKGCDLDLVIVQNSNVKSICNNNAPQSIERTVMQSRLEVVSDILKFFPSGFLNVFYIKHARVPIVKFRHSYTGIECDLSMYCDSGVQMSQMLFTLSRLDERVKPLIFVVRLWAKRVDITNTQPNNSITNFQLTLLVIFFLQQKSALNLPGLDLFGEGNLFCDEKVLMSIVHSYTSPAKFNKALGSLLLQFFKFYSTFDFDTYGCCVKTGEIILKKNECALYIKNPLDPELNVSRNVSLSSLTKFQELVEIAAEIFENFVKPGQNSITFYDLFNVTTYFKPGRKKNKPVDVAKIFTHH